MITASSQKIKEDLFHLFSDMEKCSDLFVLRPGKDFSRDRKLCFLHTIKFLLAMAGNTVGKELLDYYNYHPDTVSASAFSQQRAKLLPYALDYLFHSFTESFERLRTYQGYRLIACDGSALAIAHNPQDTMTHRRHNSLERQEKGYNQLHLNALYDLENRIYLDAVIQPCRSLNEHEALLDMMNRSHLDYQTSLILTIH